MLAGEFKDWLDRMPALVAGSHDQAIEEWRAQTSTSGRPR